MHFAHCRTNKIQVLYTTGVIFNICHFVSLLILKCLLSEAFSYLPTVLSVALLLQGEAFGSLLVYDRDTTSIVHKEQNKYAWTLMSNDSWIKDTFTIQQNFSEEKLIFGNVRGTVYEYSKDAEACVGFNSLGHFDFFTGNLKVLPLLFLCRVASEQEHFSG